jgi:TPP-dependent pyruvate/acetoin dehydrogenase alpha subunit
MKLTKEQKVKLYANMVRVRKLDELLVKAFYDSKLAAPYFHSQQGQEAIGVGVCTFLRQDDYVWYTHRGHGVCEIISKGLLVKSFLAEHYGKSTGSCNGIGFINNCYLEGGIFGLGGTVAGESTLAAGVALAAKLRGNKQIVAYFFGDGAIGEGSLHAALLMSANWKLPILWLCSNNGIAMWVPVKVAYPKENIADLAFGYGIPATVVDGQDVIAVYEATQTAIDRARSGGGPTFIEFKTCRFRSQVEGSPDICQNGLRSEEEVNVWKKRDPIKLFQEKLLIDGILTQADIDCINHEVMTEMEEAHRFAMESPIPKPNILKKALYAD